jgi:hypothetical protein
MVYMKLGADGCLFSHLPPEWSAADALQPDATTGTTGSWRDISFATYDTWTTLISAGVEPVFS